MFRVKEESIRKVLRISVFILFFILGLRADEYVPVGGYFSGFSQAVFTVGKFSYIGDGFYLRILDISDPSNPVSVGKIKCPASVVNIQVVDTIAYIADDNGDFRIINVSDPTHLEEIGFYNMENYARGIQVVDTLAYVADAGESYRDPSALRIINISDPVNLVEIGYFITSNRIGDVQVIDSFAYISGGDGFLIINVSDPKNPVEIGCFDVASGSSLYVVDTLAYVSGKYTKMNIINISDPTNPVLIEYYHGMSSPDDIYGVGNLVYIVSVYNFKIIDVSDPANPEQIGYYDLDSRDYFSVSFHVVDSLAYVAYGYDGLRIINVSDPNSLVGIGLYDTWNPPLGVEAIDDLAYVADGGDGLRIVNVSDPTDPVEIGHDTAGNAGDVQVVDSLAYVAGGSDGLRIINVSNPNNPSEIACLGTQYPVKRVHVVDSLAYVACFHYEYNNEWHIDIYLGSLRIINVSDPKNPVEVLRLTEGINAVRDVQVVDSLAYILCVSEDGCYTFLRIINVSDPKNPVEIGNLEGASGSSICIVGNLVYTGGGQILNVADPTNPIQVGEFSGGNSIHIVDDLLYVATSGGLRVFNVFNPTNSLEIGSYRILGGANDVYVVEDLVYVSAAENGLYILCKGGSKIVKGGVPPVNIDSEIKIKYFLARSERVKVEIYNVLGQKMKKLIEEISPPGEYNLRWEGNEGIYFVIVEIGDKVYKKKAIIVR